MPTCDVLLREVPEVKIVTQGTETAEFYRGHITWFFLEFVGRFCIHSGEIKQSLMALTFS